MERPTKDIILPDSHAKITLYESLVSGDFKKLQRKILENVKIDLNSENVDIPSELKDIPATVALDNQEFTLKLLVKQVSDAEGNIISDLETFLYNLSIPDSNYLEAQITEVSKASQLTPEDKKK